VCVCVCVGVCMCVFVCFFYFWALAFNANAWIFFEVCLKTVCLENSAFGVDRPWSPPSLLYDRYRVVTFPELKQPWRGVDQPPLS
jgi:hypothetical protein